MGNRKSTRAARRQSPSSSHRAKGRDALPVAPAVPPGWRAIYRVRQFCEVGVAEPKNDIGWNEFDSFAEAIEFIVADRATPGSTRLEVVLMAPTVQPYPSVIDKHRAEIAEYESRVPNPPPTYRTPDLASQQHEFFKRNLYRFNDASASEPPRRETLQ